MSFFVVNIKKNLRVFYFSSPLKALNYLIVVFLDVDCSVNYRFTLYEKRFTTLTSF